MGLGMGWFVKNNYSFLKRLTNDCFKKVLEQHYTIYYCNKSIFCYNYSTKTNSKKNNTTKIAKILKLPYN